MPSFVPKQAIKAVNQEKGRKGGIATAQKHSKEWLHQRACTAGSITRDLYGVDYYRHINSRRKVHRGWPKGKLRKVTRVVQASLNNLGLSDSILAVIKSIE